jgi:hypothetical protein
VRGEWSWSQIMRVTAVAIALWLTTCAVLTGAIADDVSQADAQKTLHKVIAFYRSQVGYNGAYLWRYAADLSAQEGEGRASKTSGWTQPPGTPSVGEAYLRAWRLTEDDVCLAAAVEAAEALVRAQLQSGGWSSHFDLSCRTYNYRVDGTSTGRNHSTFDDNKSQSALMLLMHVDEALGFSHPSLHEAVKYALDHMLAVQYLNGAWPQQFSGPIDPANYPVTKASYPTTWPKVFPAERYIGFYTLNDGNMSYIIDMLFEAHRIYENDAFAEAAVRTAEFFLLAQMPDPQPGWAQQYDSRMNPVWARKFEPPAITGGESHSVMQKLIDVYRFTGDRKFLDAIPRALAYYRDSLLPDGRLARFYEMRTNRPLYFTKTYELTFSDDDMPTHYSFKVGSGLDSLERQYMLALAAPKDQLRSRQDPLRPVRLSDNVARQAADVIAALDDRSAWVEAGTMGHQAEPLDVIEMRTLIRNIEPLARFVGASE